MHLYRSALTAIACAAALSGQSATAQERLFSFSLTAGASVEPSYFGSDSYSVSPTGKPGFTGLRLDGLELGDLDGPWLFPPGTSIRGSFRYITERDGKDELAGLDDVDGSLEVGIRLYHTAEFWQVYAETRYGVIGHEALAGEIGANAIYRGKSGFVLNAGPRAEFGNARFLRTYFGITPTESARSGLAAYRPDGGIYSIGFEIGAYQPLNDDWGISGSLRYDRLQDEAADSAIVQQGSRDQLTATIGVTRHFNLRW